MKLAEALIKRADLQTRNIQLKSRILKNVKIQDGDEPAESVAELINEYENNMVELEKLIVRINETNSKTDFNGSTLTEALAKKDCLTSRIKSYRDIYDEGTSKKDRYSRQEIKYVRCIDLKSLQTKIDKLCKEHRELDVKIQALNWTVDFL